MFKRISKAFRKLFRRNNKVAPLISNDTESSCKIVPTPLHLLPVNYGIETQKKEEIKEPLDERLERIAQNTPVTTESSVGTTEESSSESGSSLESATQNVPKQERFILVQEARKSQTVSLDTCIATERTEPRVKHVKFIFVKEAKKSEEKKESSDSETDDLENSTEPRVKQVKFTSVEEAEKSEEKKESSDSETESDDLENSTEPRVKHVKFTFVEDAEKSEEKKESSDSETESDDLENSTPSIQNSPVCQELARAEQIEADIAVQDDTNSHIEKISWTSVKDFRFCKFLGKGSFGKVYLAEHKKTQNMVAIKAMNKADIHKNQMLKSLLLEKNIMKFVQIQRTPFVMGLISAFQSEHRVFFSMELATGGDLESVIKKGAISHSSAVFYSACIVLGIQFLHENGIVHRDLKPANVLIDKDGYAKISDFGLSIAGIGYGCTMNQPVGTPLYKAPEVYEARPYTRSVDWWALGAMIYEMVVGHPPFLANTLKDLALMVTEAPVMYPKAIPRQTRNIIEGLLMKNGSCRLGSSANGAEDVAAHPFFSTIDWNALKKKLVRPPFIPKPCGKCTAEEQISIQTPPHLKMHLSRGVQEAFDEFCESAEGKSSAKEAAVEFNETDDSSSLDSESCEELRDLAEASNSAQEPVEEVSSLCCCCRPAFL